MNGDGKWFTDVAPNAPIGDAASSALRARISHVIQQWETTADHEYDTEAVHQLRVATRRASAAVRVFDDVLPGKVARKLKRRLRRLRQAAGQLRDFDVFVQQLHERLVTCAPSDRAGLDYLCGQVTHQREEATGPLRKLLKRREKIAGLIDTIKMRHRGGRTLEQHARELLPELQVDIDAAAQDNLSNPAALHALRIAGKRLRYALELLVSCFPATSIEGAYELLEELQDVLGHVHDAGIMEANIAAVIDVLNAYHGVAAERYRTGLERWQTELKTIANSGAGKFRAWQDRWQLGAVQLSHFGQSGH